MLGNSDILDQIRREVQKLSKSSDRTFIIGLVTGTIFSIFGGLFVSSYIVWLQSDNIYWGYLAALFGVIIIILLVILLLIIRKIK